MTKRILLKQETLDKIQALKKLFNITKDTTYIEKIVNDFYDFYIVPRNVIKGNPFGVSAADLINKDRFDLEDNKKEGVEIEGRDIVIYHHFDKINNSYEQRLNGFDGEILYKGKLMQDKKEMEEFWINE